MAVTKVCITFDVDFTWHTTGGFIDEMAEVFPRLWKLLQGQPDCKTTWFIRLDDQMAFLRGSADDAFTRYRDVFAELRRLGHEVGWHPHSYVRVGDSWQQNTDGSLVVAELKRHAPAARAHGLDAVRLGWGFHTNEAMAFLASAGFRVDSSAIPRPRYRWEKSAKDWTLTPPEPYFPAQADYRIPGRPSWPILEVPVSVTHVKADYDEENVQRYLNLAFHPTVLRTPLENWLERHSHLITITHPYELSAGAEHHALLAFNIDAFAENLRAIRGLCADHERPARFLTMSRFAAEYAAC